MTIAHAKCGEYCALEIFVDRAFITRLFDPTRTMNHMRAHVEHKMITAPYGAPDERYLHVGFQRKRATWSSTAS
jgi:hypothetical protein